MHDTLLTVFTGVLTLAVVIQTVLFFGIYKAVRQLSSRFDGIAKDLLKNVETLSAKMDGTLTAVKGIADGLKPIGEKLADTVDIVHRRVIDLDGFLSEATHTARMEILRVQDTIQSASEKAGQTLEILQKTIFAPINEVGAIARAIRVGIDVLFRRRRNPSRSAQDDEMFI